MKLKLKLKRIIAVLTAAVLNAGVCAAVGNRDGMVF